MFDEEAPDVLGPDPGPGSPVTATEDIVLDTPGGFSRAPGDGRQDLGPAPLAEGLRDAPPKDRHPEEDRVPRSSTDEE